MFYHVRITQKSDKKNDETKVDLSEEDLQERFIKLYDQGLPIIINGKAIASNDIDRIRISKSETPSKILIQQIRAESRASSIVFIGGPSYEWQAADRAEDITDKLIFGPPGYKKGKAQPIVTSAPVNFSEKVFVVHGHDEAMKQAVARTIERLGLTPIVLHEKPNAGRTIIEKFTDYSNVGFAVVLLSPDDIAYDRTLKPEQSKFRARQNVILELGYFLGKLGRSNVLALYNQKQDIELPSDYSGVLFVPYAENGNWQYDLVKELKACGYAVDANKLIE